MGEPEHLLSYGNAGDFGRFRPLHPLACRRGDRAVVQSHRGLELGVVLCPASHDYYNLINSKGGVEGYQIKSEELDHEYKVERDGHKVAEVSKRWGRVRDTYGIEIAPGEDDALILATAVCVDRMSHD